ncbi:MAG: amphi-Trp domain-containing protein [Deltaproteobacteria bacterium]|jgi:amphi-Trp domain-containing protein|nr:amphi-Trp domain-containing protein [Deltaproteobacteria bacterium]
MTLKKNLTHTFVTDPEAVASFFEALIEGFRKREIKISSDEREITLHPTESIDMSLSTNHRNSRTKLNISINWPETHRKNVRSLFSSSPNTDV